MRTPIEIMASNSLPFSLTVGVEGSLGELRGSKDLSKLFEFLLAFTRPA